MAGLHAARTGATSGIPAVQPEPNQDGPATLPGASLAGADIHEYVRGMLTGGV